MKKRLVSVLIIVFVLMTTGCGSVNSAEEPIGTDDQMMENIGQTDTEKNTATESIAEEIEVVSSENKTEEVNAVNPDELADVFGISISLPENPNWIVNSEYHLIDDNNLEITYHDLLADSDCVILVAKNENLPLPENEYDERLDESWEGRTINGQNIVVKVQRGKNDNKTVLATWEYNEYQFAIIGEIEGELDSGPIAKVALFIIENLN